jgi:cellulose synthase/poly-beta-1,6-N-acetylglucosamine synthase-like glycosyltransferase
LAWLSIGFVKTNYFQANDERSFPPVTIIICARNEEKKIGKCLKTIIDQEYDLSRIQVIIINDASSDTTVFQAQSVLKKSKINHKIISNPTQKGKKQSITYALQFVEHELIVIRDADTYTRSSYWLKSISDFYEEHKPDLIIGPVALGDNQGMLWALQAIENNILSVLSCGSAYYKKPFLCSGANLVFTKSIFQKVSGYQSHLHVSSGDDVLFMEDVKKILGAKISYLKSYDNIVNTYPCYNLKELLNQKIRWAAKFSVNPNMLNLVFSLLIFIINAGWLFALFYGFLVPQKGVLSLILVLLKLLIDILLLFLASRFLKNKALAWYVLPVGFIYPVYAVLVAVASVFFKPKWK